MLFHVSLHRKGFATFRALVWFLSRVDKLVIFQCALPGESLIASWFRALVWFLTSVCQLVLFQVAFESKSFVTFRALVWLLPRVDQLV